MDTMQQISTGVRILLRRPSEQKLPEDDIRSALMDLLRGYAEDLGLSNRQHASITREVAIDPTDVDYNLVIPGGKDVQVEKLERVIVQSDTIARYEVRLVPHSAWSSLYDQHHVVASIYGGNKIAINLSPEAVGSSQWFLTYRPSLLTVIEKDSPVPLPSDFIPMLKIEAALLCIPLVNDDSDQWVNWLRRTQPMYAAQKLEWNNPHDARQPGRWQRYLESSVEPQIQPIRRTDRHGHASGRTRPYVPYQ